jgi:hypothetical protein
MHCTCSRRMDGAVSASGMASLSDGTERPLPRRPSSNPTSPTECQTAGRSHRKRSRGVETAGKLRPRGESEPRRDDVRLPPASGAVKFCGEPIRTPVG